MTVQRCILCNSIGVVLLLVVAAIFLPTPLRAANLLTVVNFCAETNCTDGSQPISGLIADADGDLFGTTYMGGSNNDGTVFEIIKTASGYATGPTTLVSFNGANGANPLPLTGLITDKKGNLLGTTSLGGNGFGTVFEIARTASGYATTPIVLYSFCGNSNCTDGASPYGGLIADRKGNLFGTTFAGGACFYCGTVFEIAMTNHGYSTPIILVRFNGTNGAQPYAGLIADTHGNLFGTTVIGGLYGYGTVFEIAKTAHAYARA